MAVTTNVVLSGCARCCMSAVFVVLAACGPESPDGAAARDQGDVRVTWPEVTQPAFQALRDKARETGRVEALAEQLNAAFAFPEDLTIEFVSCGRGNAYYHSDSTTITVCYELVEFTRRTLKALTTTESELETLSIGTWYFVLLHEIGHALHDLYDLPDIGSEEDAADEVSTLLLIKLGTSEYAVAAAVFWAALDDGMYSLAEFADTHSLSQRRFFNILCLVQGAEPEYWELDEYFPSRNCEHEYESKSAAWQRVLAPWMLTRDWVREDG